MTQSQFTNSYDGLFCKNCKKMFSLENDIRKHENSCPSYVNTCYVYFFSEPAKKVFTGGFEEKAGYFAEEVQKLKVSVASSSMEVEVLRDKILQDSYDLLRQFSDKDWLKEFHISFTSEISNDAGGLMKEWINTLVAEFFNTSRQMFTRTDTDDIYFTVPTNYDQNKLSYYFFLGKLLAKALLENIPVPCGLHFIFYKQFLQQEVSYNDLKNFSKSLYDSFEQMKTNSVNDLGLGYFCIDRIINGVVHKYNLKPKGEAIEITDENKLEYIELYSQYEMAKGIEEPLNQIRNGLKSLIPMELLNNFTPEELEKLLCGESNIDVEQWRRFAQYSGEFTHNHKTIVYFWLIIGKYTQERLGKLLKFVTGTSKLPPQGFKDLKTVRGQSCPFTIVPIPYTVKSLPKAHTCFNRLELPVYQQRDHLEEALNFVTSYEFSFGIE
ncbi:hypothetical protein SteCoe_26753 [Stentor coeruleus]|uniref:HECT-type E3 ubiquitin transferase n=1 Tax=Stentor coeruleus TaxID=5963 RepID=A0A1R2BCI2_9CILI|nr:hypothetical protein SteCoe_26753 [Stentor coeruleus]